MCRTIDDLGRIVIPAYFRKTLNIVTGDLLRLELIDNHDNSVVLIVSKENNSKLCCCCGSYCNDNDNYCSNCGLDFNKKTQ